MSREYKKICRICGKEFIAHSFRAEICKDVHISSCVVCGKDFVMKPPYTTKVCGRKCGQQLGNISRKKTCLKKYGVENIMQSNEIKEFYRSACIKKYGVDNPAKSDIVKQKISERNPMHDPDIQRRLHKSMMDKYGVAFPLQSKDILHNKEQTCIKKYGVKNTFQMIDPENNLVTKSISSMKAKYGVINAGQMVSTHIKAAETRKSITASDGTHLDSSYEAIVYDWLKGQGLEFDRQIPISYEYDDKTHITLIDFKVDDILLEVKGFHLLQGCFDYAPSMVPIERKLEVYRSNDVVVVTDSQGAEILKDHHVRGIDIEVFKDNSWSWNELKSLLSIEDIFISSDVLYKLGL